MLTKQTHKIQSELAQYCRDGKLKPILGAREERLPTYRRLVFNVVKGILQKAYPITFKLLSNDEWQGLMYDFFTIFKCQDPQVWKMPHDLIEFVEESDYQHKLEKEYLLELLHFEWLEIEVHAMKNVEIMNSNESFSTNSNKSYIINPYHRLNQFEFPVHKIKPNENVKGNYFILTYRDINYGVVSFMELSPLLSITFELFNQEKSLKDVCKYLLDTMKFQIEQSILQSKLKEFILTLYNKGIILG